MPFFLRSLSDVVRTKVGGGEVASGAAVNHRWPAHLHLNLAPEARGTRVAQEMMERWQDWLTHSGSPGCHLQTFVETAGQRGYEARPVHQQTMVWAPPKAG